MPRSILLIIGGIVVAAGMVLGGVLLWKSVTRPGGILGPAIQPSPSPPATPIRAISKGNGISPAADLSASRIRFYDTKEKKLMEADFSGTLVRALAEHELQNVFRVSWAPTSTAAILEYMDEFSERQIALFDVASGTTTPLHPNVRSIAWSPDGSALIYHWRDDLSGANAIFRSAPDTSNRSQLMPIQLPAVNIFWPAPDTIIIAQKPTPAIPSLVLVRDIRTGATNSLGEDKFGVSILPSPDGKKLLVSSTRDAEGSALVTEVYNLEGTLLAALPFATLAEKCAWGSDSETLFCAIPASLAGARALPFSYWIGALSTRDVFAAYTLTTGQMRMLSEVLPDVDAVDLVIPQTEDAIAFVNRLDGTLTVLRP